MSLKLVTPHDLTRTAIETLFTRADEIMNGAEPNLTHTRIALALFNTSFPPLSNAHQVLHDVGARYSMLASPDEIASASVDVVLFSSPQTDAARALASKTDASFLNAGDGIHENPVRALIDAYAIRICQPDIERLRVAILGNLKFSAEAHSLAQLLGIFGARLSFVSPAALAMPYDLTDEVRQTAYEVEETNDLRATLLKTDVLYLSNIDALRVEKKIYEKQKNFYALTPDTFADAKQGIVVLGAWDNAEWLLAPTRPQLERAARAMLLALIEKAT